MNSWMKVFAFKSKRSTLNRDIDAIRSFWRRLTTERVDLGKPSITFLKALRKSGAGRAPEDHELAPEGVPHRPDRCYIQGPFGGPARAVGAGRAGVGGGAAELRGRRRSSRMTMRYLGFADDEDASRAVRLLKGHLDGK